MDKKIAVIGAGIAGLTCAYELQKKGFRVVVFEKNNYLGGRMATREKNGFPFDIGADHLCNLYDEIKKYCKEFGIEWEKMRFERYGVFRNDKIHDLDKVVGLKARYKLAKEYLKIKDHDLDFFDLTEAAKFDTDNAFDVMEKVLGKDAVAYLIDPFTSTYQFHSSKKISLGAVKAIMQSLKFQKKRWALHHTKGGMSALPNALGKNLEIKLKTPVEEVKPENGKVLIKYGENNEKFDAVVLASTANVSNKILQNKSQHQKDLLENTKYSTTLSIAFKVDKTILEKKHSIVWVPNKENKSVSGYVNELIKGKELIKDGKSLICTWLHEEFANPLLEKDDQEIFQAVKEELVKVCPWVEDSSELINHDIHRWPEAMPKFEQGQLQRVNSFIEHSQGAQNVYLCGDYLNSPWTEGALRCGQRVAELVALEQL